jgi:hypothetical protein
MANYKEICIPFKKFIPAGQSTFSIEIPNYHSDRSFFFSYLELMPEIFSEQAAKMDLDTEEELQQLINYKIYYKIAFDSKQPLFSPAENVVIPISVVNTVNIMKTINTFYEFKKPVGLKHLGMFIDWYDEKFDKVLNMTWDEFVQNVMAEEYYNKQFDPNLHYNQLPESARSIPGANNYLFPTNLSPDVLETIRFRINIAPHVNVVCSTNGQFLSMGFIQDQIGPRRKNNKFYFGNDEPMGFKTITAFLPPEIDIIPANPLNIFLETNTTMYTTEPFTFSITKEKSYSNANYKELCEAMNEYALNVNFIFQLGYDETTKTFTFEYPINASFNNIIIVLSTDLAERLGFGLTTDIKSSANTGKKVEDAFDVNIVETKARALIMDTGPVVVSDNNASSMTTVGITNSYMATLYPANFGTTMVIPSAESSFLPPTMILSKNVFGSSGFVTANFKLSRFFENDQFVNLRWTMGAYISGTLRGSRPKY